MKASIFANSQPSTRLIFCFGLLALISSLLIYLFYSSNNQAVAPDFYVQWHGTKVALSGGNPYAAQATLDTQLYLRGAPVPAQDDQLVFVYPLYSVYLSTPLVWLPLPYEVLAALWMGLLLAGNCTGSWLLLAALDWPSGFLPRLAIFLIVLLAGPFAACVLLGQMAAGVYVLLCLTFWGLRRHHDGLAGFALALATVKPTLVVLVILFCLIWGLFERRGRFLAVFGLTLGLLFLSSLLWRPGWLAEFMAVTTSYSNFKPVMTGPGFLFENWPGAGLLAGLLWLVLAGWLVYSWYLAIRGGQGEFELAFGLSLLMTLLLLPQTNVINTLLLMLPFLLVVRPLARLSWFWLVLPLPLIIGSWFLQLVVFKVAYGWSIITLPLLLLPFMYQAFRKIISVPQS